MLWLVFNKNGQLINSYNVGNAPVAGTNEFQIFAVFKDLPTVYNGASIKFYKPDRERTAYTKLPMSHVVETFTGETNVDLQNNVNYPGFLFDFSVYEGDSLLDTTGLWRAVITLYASNNDNIRNVVGSALFSVGNGIESADGVVISTEDIIDEIIAALASKLDVNPVADPSYIKVITTANIDTYEFGDNFSENDLVCNKNDLKVYRLNAEKEPILLLDLLYMWNGSYIKVVNSTADISSNPYLRENDVIYSLSQRKFYKLTGVSLEPIEIAFNFASLVVGELEVSEFSNVKNSHNVALPDYITQKIAADDTYVTKSTAQTISGNKKFTGNVEADNLKVDEIKIEGTINKNIAGKGLKTPNTSMWQDDEIIATEEYVEGYTYDKQTIEEKVNVKSTVSGTYENNYWKTITIDGTTKEIGGGSADLTAGYGIDIENDEISVDTDVMATKDFVNSSIATQTANFLGTFNIVTDLELTTSATEQEIIDAIADKMVELEITPTNNDYVYVAYPNATVSTQFDKFDRYKYNAEETEWSYEYTLNNSSFTAEQWAAINSGITSQMIGTFATKNLISDEYSSSGTYAVGDYCIYNNTLYRCTTAVSSPEDFDSTKWVVVNISTEFGGLVKNNTWGGSNTFQDAIFGYAKFTSNPNYLRAVDVATSQPIFYATNVYMATRHLRPMLHDTYDIGQSASGAYRNLYLSGDINLAGNITDGTYSASVADISNGLFNVINASDIASNYQLTADQIAIIKNGKPTRIIGTIGSNITNTLLLTCVEETNYIKGLCILNASTTFLYASLTQYIIDKTNNNTLTFQNNTKFVRFSNNGMEITTVDNLTIQGKIIPAYPTTNTSPQNLQIGANGGSLTWEDAPQIMRFI